MRKKELIVNYYNEKDKERLEELQYALTLNINRELFNTVHIVFDNNKTDYKPNIETKYTKVKCHNNKKQPTYKDVFNLCNSFKNSEVIYIFANLDIIFDKTVANLDKFDFDNVFYAISRNDCIRKDSQDAWIWKGIIKVPKDSEFTLGIAGCDNKIAYLMKEHGYEVLNPYSRLNLYHLHKSNVRNYIKDDGTKLVVPPPYYHVNPY